MSTLPAALPDILDVHVLSGPDAPPEATPDVLVEVPHGATTQAHFDATRALLGASEVPSDIDAFYWVNTDLGAPEYGLRFAQMITDPSWVRATSGLLGEALERACERASTRTVCLLRGIVPRTFADLNRVWVTDAQAFTEAGLTRAFPDFVADADRPALEARHRAYQDAVEAVYASVCALPHGAVYNLHTYAPISVAARPDEPVLETLRAAYAPEAYGQQVRRPIGQLITARADGPETAAPALVSEVLSRYHAADIALAHNTPFQLHPVTTLDGRAYAYPGRILSVELSREALARVYAPFVPLDIDPERVEHLTAPLAQAHVAWDARFEAAPDEV